MVFSGESRWRKVALYAGLGLLILLLLGALQAFNTTLPIRIWHYTFTLNYFNPETASETLIFTGLTGLVFLLLLLLLMLLLRNILKIYTGQGSSGLGARLRSRMVLGAVIIALMPAVFMFLFSYVLMNRSLDRWFSPNTTQLREDSNRVVMELAQYVTDNARASGVDCRLRRYGGRPARASEGAGLAPDYAGRRVCHRIRQGFAGDGEFSGATRVKPGHTGSVAGGRGAGNRDLSQGAALGKPANLGATQGPAGHQSRGRGICAGHISRALGQGGGDGAAHAARAKPDHGAHPRRHRHILEAVRTRNSIRTTFSLYCC